MSKQERKYKILENIELHKDINIKSLAAFFDVSEMTIRRDLKELEKEALNEEYNLVSAIKSENSNKEKIGLKAAELVSRNNVIFIDTGSTTVKMVEELLDIQNLSVQTCNVEVLNRISYNQNTNVYFSGGYLHLKSQMCESKESLEYLKRNKSEFAFISAAGVDRDLGLTCAYHYEVDTKQTVINNTKKVVLLIDSSKFDSVSSNYFADLSIVNILITDKGITKEWIKYLKSINVELIIA